MKTVGSIFSEERKKRGLSLETVASSTKIRKEILAALETGNWEKLPHPTFIKGFIRNYGQFLGLDTTELLAFFRREYDEKRVVRETKMFLKMSRSLITPTSVTVAISTLVLLLISGYLYFQYESFTGSPFLEVIEPRDNSKITTNEVSVVGRTDSEAILKINGQEIQILPGGAFNISVSLATGFNSLVVTASNRFGKISTVKRVVVVEQPIAVSPEASPSAQIKELDLTVEVKPNSAWLSVEIDSKEVFEGILLSGVSKNFKAKEKIKLKTGNAGSTKVILNGDDRGNLGKEGEAKEKEFHI